MAAKASLATQAVRGIFWTASPSLVQAVVMVVLYAYLPTEEMGRFEWALTLVLLLCLIGDLGLGSALVQLRQVEERHFSSAFWANLLLGLAIAGGVIGASPQLAGVLGRDAPASFERVLGILALQIPFASVSGIFRSRLQRDLRFRSMALAEIVSVLSSSVAAIALLPYGLLSPLLGAVSREVTLLVGLWWSARWRPRLAFGWAALKDILPFSLNFTGSRCVNYLTSNLDAVFIYPLLGPQALGYYRLAYRLTLMPLTRLSTTITRVSFPTFATIQDDDQLLRQGYLKSVQSIALLLWPGLLGLAVFAPEIAMVLSGMNGQDMGPVATPLRLLALATLLKAVGTTVGSVFMAKGKADWTLYWSLFTLAVLAPSLYWGVGRGVGGVGLAVAVTSLLFLLLSQHLVNRLIRLRFADFVRSLAPATRVGLAVAVVLLLARLLFPDNTYLALLLAGAVWLSAYAAALRVLAWKECRQYWRSFRGR
jgi:PST family polysaccharide transporter